MRLHPILIALLSVSLLTIEMIWTRIFSAEFLYTFAFLILSTAVLGLGIGALLVHLFPRLDAGTDPGGLLSLTGAAILGGPPLVFLLDVDFSHLFSRFSSVVDVLLVVVILAAPFVLGGMILAALFRSDPDRLPQMYTADLLGAGAGVLLAVPAMNLIGTPAAASWAALPVLLAAGIASPSWRKLVPLALLAVMALLSGQGPALLQADREERAPVRSVHWDAMAKIKVYEYNRQFRGIEIDNAANSPVYAFDGEWGHPDSLRFSFGIDVSWLIRRMRDCSFLSLGAGGGSDVLQALQAGATDIHAVEVNGHINDMMQTGELRAFSGNIYNDPRVRVITEDARTYVRRQPARFDLIYSLSSNSFAALASGAFALAENYLFTTDAFRDYWNALTPRGCMMMEHQMYVPRLVAELIAALREEGVESPEAHFAVYDLPRMRRKMILLSKVPLDDAVRYSAFGSLSEAQGEDIRLLYPPPDSLRGNLIDRIVTDGWQAASAGAGIDLEPCSDDRPYTAQLGLWKHIDFSALETIGMREVLGFPIAHMMILLILSVVLCIAVPLNLLPYLLRRPVRLRPVPWLYFFVIGIAFMSVEVMLIQRYTLFLGASTYSVAVVLFTVLVGSGIGSRYSARVPSNIIFAAITGLLLLEAFLSPVLTSSLVSLPLAGRVAVTALLLLPLAFFMGMPFPRGGVRVGVLIDWGFAVNGTASVLGSTLVMLVAFEFGIRIALLAGALLYAAAWLLFLLERRWTTVSVTETVVTRAPAPAPAEEAVMV